MNCESNQTFRILRKRTTFISGISSIVDFFGEESRKYNLSSTEEKADMDSIYSDWKTVGDDMKKAMKNYDK